MEEMIFIILKTVYFLVGLSVFILTTRAVLLGANYIAASNYAPNLQALPKEFHGGKFKLKMFKATPIAIIIFGGWAGFSIVYDLLWPLGDSGFYSHRDQEWQSYRTLSSSLFGSPLGIAFAIWLVKLCHKVQMIDENGL